MRRSYRSSPSYPVVRNMGWLTMERLIQLGTSAIVTILVARHYGPIGFGDLNLVIASVSLMYPFTDFAQGILVRDLILRAEDESRIIGSALVISGVAATVGCITCITIWATRSGTLIGGMFLLYGTAVLLRPGFVLDLWFQSKLWSNRAVSARVAAFVAAAAFRLGVVVFGGSLWVLSIGVLIETSLTTGLYLWLAGRRGLLIGRIRASRGEVRRLLRDCYPLALGGLSIALYTRVDQIMLAGLGSQREVGLYSAAVKLVEIPYFLGTVVSSSFLPGLSRLRGSDKKQYGEMLATSLMGVLYGGVIIAVALALAAPALIDLLYSKTYIDALPVIWIMTVNIPMVYIGVVQTVWILNEGLQGVLLLRSLTGAGLVVVMNLVLIPSMGIVGAAISATSAQLWIALGSNGLRRQTRPLFYMTLGIFNPYTACRQATSRFRRLLAITSSVSSIP